MQASKRFLALSVTSIALVSLAGCSSMAEKLKSLKAEPEVVVVEVALPERVESKPERTSRELAVSWDNIGRAGAAVHQPGYIHVLGKDGHISFMPSNAGSGDGSGAGTGTGTGRTSKGGSSSKGYSMYQLSRWERYCDSGKGMDERDWRFIKDEGYNNAPLDALGGTCLQPIYRYEQYMTAWVRFCTSSPEITHNDRRIVDSTSRPFSQVNPCQALLK